MNFKSTVVLYAVRRVLISPLAPLSAALRPSQHGRRLPPLPILPPAAAEIFRVLPPLRRRILPLAPLSAALRPSQQGRRLPPHPDPTPAAAAAAPPKFSRWINIVPSLTGTTDGDAGSSARRDPRRRRNFQSPAAVP